MRLPQLLPSHEVFQDYFILTLPEANHEFAEMRLIIYPHQSAKHDPCGFALYSSGHCIVSRKSYCGQSCSYVPYYPQSDIELGAAEHCHCFLHISEPEIFLLASKRRGRYLLRHMRPSMPERLRNMKNLKYLTRCAMDNGQLLSCPGWQQHFHRLMTDICLPR